VVLRFDGRNYVVQLVTRARSPVYVVVIDGVREASFATQAEAVDAFRRLRQGERRPIGRAGEGGAHPHG
jgi:hypothetical protein